MSWFFVSCNLQCHLSMIWTSGIKLSDCRNKFCVLLFTHKLMPPPPKKKEDLLRLHEKILIFLIYVKSQWKRISKKFYVVNKINNNNKNQHTEYLWTITPSGKKPIYQLCTSEWIQICFKTMLMVASFSQE